MNQLLFGDNLRWLQDAGIFPAASVDLVYLDPPFNSNADYNVLFKEASGEASQAQFHAFTDTWNWADAAETYTQFLDTCPNTQVARLLEALHSFLQSSPMMAYLSMMAPRIVELHRILKPTGSLFLHCDPTASHYLRMVLDGVFGARNFRSEIIWKRSHAHNSARGFGANHDTILYYAKSDAFLWNAVYHDYNPSYTEKHYRHVDEAGRRYKHENPTGAGISKGVTGKPWREIDPAAKGRHWAKRPEEMDRLDKEGKIHWPQKKGAWPYIKVYLDEMHGSPAQDVWTDIDVINMMAKERLGYPTQKPMALLDRIIVAASNPNDIVLDPFCGCGTTIHSAQKLGRRWIGIDITYLAVNLIKRRLQDAFGAEAEYVERGQPTDFESARRLAGLDKFQFQHWALSLVGARPLREGSGRGADRGVDGMLFFYEGRTERARIIVQVKGGGVKRADVATLVGDVNNQKAAAGILVTLEKPTRPMREEAAEAGRYVPKLYPSKNFPRIQILTIEGLLSGLERVEAPPQASLFARAEREGIAGEQEEMI